MYNNFKIVKVDYEYCDFLRKYDKKVSYNVGTKDLRPFVGVLFMVEKYQYFAPLSSPKTKHKKLKNTLDLIKMKDGEYGVVNFNNMIPVTSKNYTLFDLNKKTENKEEKLRLQLLRKQLRWLTSNKDKIIKKSKLLYNLYKKDKLPNNVKDRCCNFPLLEKKCKLFGKNDIMTLEGK